MSLLFQLMDEWHCERSDRSYRQKFPDDLFTGGENGESLNGQIWFGAECLAAGSNIMNHEAESEMLRPMVNAAVPRTQHSSLFLMRNMQYRSHRSLRVVVRNLLLAKRFAFPAMSRTLTHE